MPQIANQELAVGSKTVQYVPAGTQVGKQPSLWTTVGPDLSLDMQNQVTHLVVAGEANRNVHVNGTVKNTMVSNGVTVVSGISSFTGKLSFPKNTTLVQREEAFDTYLAFLVSNRSAITKTETFY